MFIVLWSYFLWSIFMRKTFILDGKLSLILPNLTPLCRFFLHISHYSLSPPLTLVSCLSHLISSHFHHQSSRSDLNPSNLGFNLLKWSYFTPCCTFFIGFQQLSPSHLSLWCLPTQLKIGTPNLPLSTYQAIILYLIAANWQSGSYWSKMAINGYSIN